MVRREAREEMPENIAALERLIEEASAAPTRGDDFTRASVR
jgi:hypothetical protein